MPRKPIRKDTGRGSAKSPDFIYVPAWIDDEGFLRVYPRGMEEEAVICVLVAETESSGRKEVTK